MRVPIVGVATDRARYNGPMYLIAIAWLYVALMAAIADGSVLGGIMTFLFYGIAPLALVLWLLGTPLRRQRLAARERLADSASYDRGESETEQ